MIGHAHLAVPDHRPEVETAQRRNLLEVRFARAIHRHVGRVVIEPVVRNEMHVTNASPQLVQVNGGGWSLPSRSRRLAAVADDRAERHRKAAKAHDEAAQRHEEAARNWVERGKAEHAELERRNAELERAAASLERDRAELAERD
jgi:hypothetical protein